MSDGGMLFGVLTFIVSLILIPIIAHLFKRNEMMHDTNQAVLAKHSEALAILIEKDNAGQVQSKETTRTVNQLTVQVARLTTAIEGYKSNG